MLFVILILYRNKTLSIPNASDAVCCAWSSVNGKLAAGFEDGSVYIMNDNGIIEYTHKFESSARILQFSLPSISDNDCINIVSTYCRNDTIYYGN